MVDVGSRSQLRAAHCTYMTVIDPAQVVHVSDFTLPEVGGCGFPILTRVKTSYATDYYRVFGSIYKAEVELHAWVLIGSTFLI